MDKWHAEVKRSTRWPTIFGIFILGLWLFGFGAWAFVAPIDGAVVSSGSFVATGQNKLVQHLEGGIVREILVKEGAVVDAGQPLIRLDDTGAQARLKRLTMRMTRLVAMQARLQAEIAGKKEVTFPKELLAEAKDREVAEVLERQRAEFRVRRTKIDGEVEVLKREIQGQLENLTGFQAQLDAAKAQAKLFKNELKDKEELLGKALVRRTEVMAIQRAEARAVGDIGQLIGRVGDSKERIARAEQQILQVHSTAQQRGVEELRGAETEIDDIREQIRAARDVVERVDVRAPERGIVVKLNHHTRGGVIAPGATLLELLPVNEELIIETRVLPADVAHVKEGQPALVRLSAANQRLVPFIDAKVTYVSADAVVEGDPRRAAVTGAVGTFVVRVRIDEKDMQVKAKDFTPIPGMPAEVFIKTGERTYAEYMLKPIADSFARAFREQ
jgi:HlyD family secretion protein